MAQSISTNTFGVARFVVSPDATQGTHTTISAAIASASSGDIIWVREGTYTENVTTKGGVTIQGIATNGGSVVMGSLTITDTGASAVSNLNFSNTSGSSLIISGTNVSVITLENIVFDSSTSGSPTMSITNTNADLKRPSGFYSCTFSNDTQPYFNFTSTPQLEFYNCLFRGANANINVMNTTAQTIFMFSCTFDSPISITAGAINCLSTNFNTSGQGQPNITTTSTSSSGFLNCSFLSSTYNFQVTSPGLCSMQQCLLNANSPPLAQGTGTIDYSLITAGFGVAPIFAPTLTVNGLPVRLGNATNFTSISVADTPYTVTTEDEYISVDTSGGAVTVLFPDTPAIGQEWVVKDAAGTAATNNITISTVTGSDLIDGGTNYLMSADYEAVNIIASSLSTYQIY